MKEETGGSGADSEENEEGRDWRQRIRALGATSAWSGRTQDCRSLEEDSSSSEANIAEERHDQPPVALPKVLPRHEAAEIKGSFGVDEDPPPECDYQLVERPPCIFPDGSTYKGQWCGDHPMGEGCKTFPDGRKYQGEFYCGKAHGTGSGLLGDGTKYVGPWLNDVPHGGNGFHARHDGGFYLGEFVNGVEHGEGTLTMPDRSTFVGQFNSGLRDGKGQAVYRAIQQNKVVAVVKKKGSKSKTTLDTVPALVPTSAGLGLGRKYIEAGSYEGEFLKDNVHGDGIFQWADGRRYKGQWEMNKMHGHGKYTFADGRKYEGQYQNSEKSGIGTYEWPDGRVYVGQVLRGAQHGRGVYMNTKGKHHRGMWHLGRPVSALSSQKQQDDFDWICEVCSHL